MPTVTLPYVPADGTTLDADQLNQDLYSTTPGESIYEVSNGNLEALVNFQPFPFYTIFNGMLRQGDVAYSKSTGVVNSQDYIEQVWGVGDAQRSVAGCAITWYQREPASLAVISIGYHASWWRIREKVTNDNDVDGPAIVLDLYLDDLGSAIPGCRRYLPISVNPSPYGGSPVTDWGINEATLARYTNIHFSVEDLNEGWHTVSMRLKVKQNQGMETTDGTLYEQAAGDIQSQHRVRFRVRNATVLSLW
jgi:hypothetical protein